MKDLIKFYSLDEYLSEDAFPAQNYIVDGLISRQELTLLSATAKTGKTWLGLHLALSVASGKPFLGNFQTHSGRVIIIQTEVSHPQFRERIQKALDNFPGD